MKEKSAKKRSSRKKTPSPEERKSEDRETSANKRETSDKASSTSSSPGIDPLDMKRESSEISDLAESLRGNESTKSKKMFKTTFHELDFDEKPFNLDSQPNENNIIALVPPKIEVQMGSQRIELPQPTLAPQNSATTVTDESPSILSDNTWKSQIFRSRKSKTSENDSPSDISSPKLKKHDTSCFEGSKENKEEVTALVKAGASNQLKNADSFKITRSLKPEQVNQIKEYVPIPEEFLEEKKASVQLEIQKTDDGKVILTETCSIQKVVKAEAVKIVYEDIKNSGNNSASNILSHLETTHQARSNPSKENNTQALTIFSRS